MRFSVIIPVYNVEKYLDKCLSSVMSQSYQSFEVIVVDDETPDNSMVIVDRYVQLYPEKIRVIHQKNKGLGGARNTGVEVAQGEYLIFVDSDDYIEPNTLYSLNQRLEQVSCDMLMFNYQEVTEDGKVLVQRSLYSEDRITSVEKEATLLLGPPAAWNKVYRREFFVQSGVLFPEKLLYEDVVTRILLIKAKNIQLCAACFYNYVQRSGSIMKSKVSERNLEIIQILDSVYNRLKCDNVYSTYKEVIDASLVLSVLSIINVVNDQQWNHSMQTTLVKYIVQKFPNIQSNSYIAGNDHSQIVLLLKKQYLRFFLQKRFQRYWTGIKVALLRVPLIAKMNNICKNRK